MRRLTILALILIMTLTLTIAPGVSAEDPLATWCYLFDFRLADNGQMPFQNWFSLVNGEWVEEVGVSGSIVRLHASFPGADITHVVFNGTSNSSTFTGDNSLRLYSGALDPGDGWPTDSQHTLLGLTNIGASNRRETAVTTQPTRTLRVSQRVMTGYVRTRSIRLYGTGVSPFGPSNCDGYDVVYMEPLVNYGISGLIENENTTGAAATANAVLGFSGLPGAKVSAGMPGTITNIVNLRYACDEVLGPDCTVIVPADGDSNSGYAMRIPVDMYGNRAASLVSIQASDRLIHYVVRNPERYISPGQEITAGCWLGETVELEPVPTSSIPGIRDWLEGTSANITNLLNNASDEISNWLECIAAGNCPPGGGASGGGSIGFDSEIAQGMTVIAVTNGATILEDQLDTFVVAANPENQCAIPGDYEACIGDAMFRQPGDWNASAGVTWRLPGVTLAPGASIERLAVLDENRDPVMDVMASGYAGARLNFVLGAAGRALDVSGPPREYRVTGGEPDNPPASTVRLYNPGSVPVDVDYACINYTRDESLEPIPLPPSVPPPGGDRVCYFVNHSFSEGGGAGWITNNVRFGTGQIHLLPVNATFGQTVTLAPGNYTIRATVTPWGTNTGGTGELGMEYTYPGGDSWVQIGSETLDSFQDRGGVLDLAKTFTIEGSDVSGTFTMRSSESGIIPSSVSGLSVRMVCLENGDTTTGDEPPAWPADPTKPEPPIFNELCEVVAVPTGDGVGAWTVYHWSNLQNFFQCDLMRLLNKIHETIIGLGRYFPALAQHYADWADVQLLPWIAGHLANIAQGRLTFVEVQSGETCNSLWCVISNLFGTIGGIFDNLRDVIISALETVLGPLVGLVGAVLFELVGPLLDVGFFLLTQLVTLFQRAAGIFSSIINLWNSADPVTFDWMPSCNTDPQGNGVCIGLWTMENTIFSGWGMFLIPLIIGYASIQMMIWSYEEIRKTIEKAARYL